MSAGSRPVLSTYRVQFSKDFTFADALQIVGYLVELGVSHLYASPILAARKGSTHGYDVVDFSKLNPDLGSEEDFEKLVTALHERGIGLVLDIVPNHMAVGTDQNRLWNSVLAQGEDSEFSEFFDIHWTDMEKYGGRRTVFLPVLGEPIAEALAKKSIEIVPYEGRLVLRYHERHFPLSKETESAICHELLAHTASKTEQTHELRCVCDKLRTSRDEALRGYEHLDLDALLNVLRDHHVPEAAAHEELALLNASPALQEILFQQFYVLGLWSDDQLFGNYRRFFDVNELAGLQVHRPEVFQFSHFKIFELLRAGKLDGLRVDHPDGLRDPKGYFLALRSKVTELIGTEAEFPIYAEKILGIDEALPEGWNIDGTTGYDFLNQLGGLFIRKEGMPELERVWKERSHQAYDSEEEEYRCKSLVLEELFRADFERLMKMLFPLIRSGDRSDQYRSALAAIIACFPVYRSYRDCSDASPVDRAHIRKAVDRTLMRTPGVEAEALEIEQLLLESFASASKSGHTDFTLRFQQLTAPVTAKGIEDTAFYRSNRMIALNEVGGSLGSLGATADEVHEYLVHRADHFPFSMSTLSTHDTKRSEDARFRISAITECPELWARAVAVWERCNRRFKREVDNTPLPDPAIEYFLYQSLVGSWPEMSMIDESFVCRTVLLMQKASREAKVWTSWRKPNEGYESILEHFVRSVLDKEQNSEFIEHFEHFHAPIRRFGAFSSLSASIVKLTAPGIPDTYQGTEVSSFCYVDPDNRRPVDFVALRERLGKVDSRSTGTITAGIEHLHDAAVFDDVKLSIASQLLRLRREKFRLFRQGNYIPLRTLGGDRDCVFAFSRVLGDGQVVVLVSRFLFSLDARRGAVTGSAWGDTKVVVPRLDQGTTFEDIVTGKKFEVEESLRCDEVFEHAPFAVLVRS